MNPFIWLIDTVISFYAFLLIVWIVMHWLISFKIINAYQPFVFRVTEGLDKLFEPPLRRIRQHIPDLGGLDLSPIVLLLGLKFVQYSLVYYLG